MSAYSIISNNRVINVIDVDEQFILDNYDNFIVLRGTYPVGSKYRDGEIYSPLYVSPNQIVPTAAATTTAIRIISVRSFMQRFTQAQRIAIRNSNDDILKDLYADLMASKEVHLDLPELSDGLDYLISLGIIQSHEKTILLRDGEIVGGIIV